MYKKIKDIDVEEIRIAIKNTSSKRQAIALLKCNSKLGENFHYLNVLIDQHNIDISHYDPFHKYKKISSVIEKSYSLVDIAKNIGLVSDDTTKINARICRNIQKFIKENNLDVSHFRHSSKGGFGFTRTDEEVFSKNSPACQTTVKKRYIEKVKYECAICYISNWQGKKISLQLDHIDGDNKNSLMSNLRLLCPNCHSQTETFGIKNKTFRLLKNSKIKDNDTPDIRKKESNYLKQLNEKRKERIEAILSSSIDFSKYGWGAKLGKMLEIAPSKSAIWLRKNMPVFYEQNCFKQSPVVKLTEQQKEENREQRRKIKSNEYKKIQSLFASGVKRNEIARRYKVHYSSIEYILKKQLTHKNK